MAKWSKNIITYNASLQKGGVGFVQRCIPKPIGRCLMVSKDLWNEKALKEQHILTVTACGTEVGQEELPCVQSTVWFGLEEKGSSKFLSYWSALEKQSGFRPETQVRKSKGALGSTLHLSFPSGRRQLDTEKGHAAILNKWKCAFCRIL